MAPARDLSCVVDRWATECGARRTLPCSPSQPAQDEPDEDQDDEGGHREEEASAGAGRSRIVVVGGGGVGG